MGEATSETTAAPCSTSGLLRGLGSGRLAMFWAGRWMVLGFNRCAWLVSFLLHSTRASGPTALGRSMADYENFGYRPRRGHKEPKLDDSKQLVVSTRVVAELRRRPWWMNVLWGFCLYMAFYLPFDLLFWPVAQDVEDWLEFVLQGWMAELAAPLLWLIYRGADYSVLHWPIYCAGAYGFWTMSRWMWPWAALYMAENAIAMLLWNLLDEQGSGWLTGLVWAAVVAVPAVGLWRSRARFQSAAAT